MKRTLFFICCFVALAMIGCGSGSGLPKAKGEGNIRAINAIPTAPGITFLIEEQPLASVEYRNSSNAATYDGLPYTFNFEALFPGEAERRRVASADLTVGADKEYIFLVTGELAEPTITLWEGDARAFESTETVFAVQFAHTAESMNNAMGDIDVYFAAPGVVPVIGEQRGTLSFGEILPAIEIQEGDQVLIITAAGDPSTVLFTSDTLALTAQTSLLFSLFDGDANDTAPMAVRIYNPTGASSIVADVNFPSTIRFVHASMALATSDIYTGETLTTPIVTGHAFADITDDIAIADGATLLSYTAENNVGAPLFEATYAISAGVHNQFAVVGADIDSLFGVGTILDRRSVDTIVKFGFLNTASNHAAIDLYLVDTGLDIADSFPRLSAVPFGNAPITGSIDAASYDLYLTTVGEKTVIAGPIPLDAALGDIVDLIAIDTADPATADVLFLPIP